MANLLDGVKADKDKPDGLSEDIVLEWSAQLASALKFIHSLSILHRDLKTKNIFITKGVAKLGDFGIAKVLDGTHDSSNTFAGTPFYMSPEALHREQYADKADVWSLGCIMYEMCTLKQAFVGATLMVVMCAILDGPLPTLPERFSNELQMLVAAMLARKPDERITAGEVLASKALKDYPKTKPPGFLRDGKDGHAKGERDEILSKIRGQATASRSGGGGGGGGGGSLAMSTLSTSGKLPPWILEHPEVFPGGIAPSDTVKTEGSSASASGAEGTGGSASASASGVSDGAETGGSVSGEDGGAESDSSEAYTTASESAGESDDQFEDAECSRRPSQTIVAAGNIGPDDGGGGGGGAARTAMPSYSQRATSSNESYLASMMLQNASISAKHGGNLDSETAAQAMSYFAAMQGGAGGAPPMEASGADEMILRRASGAAPSSDTDSGVANASGGGSPGSLRASRGSSVREFVERSGSLARSSSLPAKTSMMQQRRLSGVLLEAQDVLHLEVCEVTTTLPPFERGSLSLVLLLLLPPLLPPLHLHSSVFARAAKLTVNSTE